MSAEDQFWSNYRDIEHRLTTLRDRLATIEGVEGSQWADPSTNRGQTQAGLNVLVMANVAARAGTLGDAYQALSGAEQIYNAALTRLLLPDVEVAGTTREQRHNGGQERGRAQAELKAEKVRHCRRIAREIWNEARPGQRISKYQSLKSMAPYILNQYRRERLADPPSHAWIKNNIRHPKKENHSS